MRSSPALEELIRNALELIDDLCTARSRSGAFLLGLDFDGTLAPIVPQPAAAALPDAARPLLAALARRADTRVAFISGRALDDLAQRVRVAGVYYAGNHGLEIAGPDLQRVHPAAVAVQNQLHTLGEQLARELAQEQGVIVEDKGLTLSVHYRMVADETSAARVRAHVAHAAAAHAAIRLTHGKKVIEIRPDVAWHKGRAFHFLRTTIEERHGAGPAVFIGDDRTDEDVFRELSDADHAIVVGDPPPADTAARACLRSTDQVIEFLRRLARNGTTAP